jgi:phosphocarrier protein HPr
MAMTIFTGEVEVLDPIGMHARPAGQIAKLVKESGLEVVIIREGEETKANSALRLMAMKVKTGEKVTVSVDAADQAAADAVIAQIQEFLKG